MRKWTEQAAPRFFSGVRSALSSRRRRLALRCWPELRNELYRFEKYSHEKPLAVWGFEDGLQFTRWLRATCLPSESRSASDCR